MYKIYRDGEQYCVHRYGPDGAEQLVEGACHVTYHEAFTHMETLFAAQKDFSTSVMVGFFLPSRVKETLYRITLDAGLEPLSIGDYHITLALLGDVTTLAAHKERIATVLRTLTNSRTALSATVTGVDRFTEKDPTPVYAHVEAGYLAEFRETLVAALDAIGVPVASDYAYTPHITLAYLGADKALPVMETVVLPVNLGALTLAWGAERIELPLIGNKELVMEETTTAVSPATLTLTVPSDTSITQGTITSSVVTLGSVVQAAPAPRTLREIVQSTFDRIFKNDPESEEADATPLHGPFPGDEDEEGPLSEPGARPPTDKKKPKKSKVEQILTRPSKEYLTPSTPGLFERHKVGLVVGKGLDGRRLMFIVTSNAYPDREDETIATKALREYVEAAWAIEGQCTPGQPLLFWHKGQPIGDVVWCDLEGPFLMEVAKERRNRIVNLAAPDALPRLTTVKAVWDAIEAHPTLKWAASHGFEYPPEAKSVDGVYSTIYKFETSVLPLAYAANPFTLAAPIEGPK